jgi:2-polyprenyl-6-methoxyphenol hydroxylase-like FAD-dependent oxidoreductase
VFGALRLDLTLIEDNPVTILPVPQRQLTAMLEERALELGVEIRRGHELAGLTKDVDGVTLEIAGPDGPYRLRTGYLVGADGGTSVTRKLSGIDFPGVSREDAVSRTANVSVPKALIDPATGGLVVPGHGVIPPFFHYRTDNGLFVYAPLPTGTLATTMERGGTDDGSPLTFDELRESTRRVLGADIPYGPPAGDGPHLLRRLAGGNTRIAEKYRDGRVLLVGDAAHVHSGIGGPGLNLGMQDAIALGWKLAAQIHGWAPPGLLDTYEAERRPVAERVVMHTQAQSALIAPGDEVTKLRELFGELLRLPGTVQHIADLMAGADIRYDMGAEAPHPLTGRWAPDVPAELTATARPLLLDSTGSLAEELAGWRGRVDVVTVPAASDFTAMLMRPDCYVAWATSAPEPGEGERKALRAALERWFGDPVDM